VAYAQINPETLIASILRVARGMPDASAYLAGKHKAALEAVMAGDEYVTSTSDEGGSNTAERGVPAATLLQLYELALQRYEAEQTNGTSQMITGGTDFSQGYTRV
jgi:hypothetical protein